ncbi:MAG: hypothetical protein ABIL62_12100 [Planctomycetota bacterium]
MQVDGKQGRQSLASGQPGPLRLDASGNLVVSAYGGKYADAALAGRLFSVANQAKVAVTANLATTWTGLGIANPTGSGKNIILHEFGWSSDIVNPAEGVVGLMTTTDSGFAAALTARSGFFGTGTSVAYCDDGATIATPVLERVCGSTAEGAITTAMQLPVNIYQINGSLVLAPGRAVCTYHSIGGTASITFHFMWEEVDA